MRFGQDWMGIEDADADCLNRWESEARIGSGDMRTATEIRERAAATLESMLMRPGMYGTGQSFEGAVLTQLHDLAFIDAREAEIEREIDLLRAQGLFGALGAWGALASAIRLRSDFTDQLASIYARVATQLGYFAPARRMTNEEWTFASEVESWATMQPRFMADVEERYGAPSYRRSGQFPSVLGYAGPDDDGWLYFDFGGNAASRPLEFLRLPVSPFAASVVDLRVQSEEESSPEDVYRRFLIASLSGDEARISPFLVTHEDPTKLWAAAYPDDVASLLASLYREMDVVRVVPDTETVALVSDGCPIPLTMVKEGSRWKVDADPLIQQVDARNSGARSRS